MNSSSRFQPQLLTLAAPSRQTSRRSRSSLFKAKLTKKIVPSSGTRNVRVMSAFRSPKTGKKKTMKDYGTALKEGTGRSTHWIQSRQISTELLEDNDLPTFPKPTSKTHEQSAGAWLKNDLDNMISGISPALYLGQCFSLLGISNVAFQNGREAYFRWLSFRMLFSTIISSLLVLFSLLEISLYVQTNKNTIISYQSVVFYLNCFVASCLFIRLGRRWPSLCAEFDNLENHLSAYGSSRGLRKRMWIVTATILILVLVEHSVAQANSIIAVRSNTHNISQGDWLERYYAYHFEQVNFHVPYSPVVAIVAFLVNLTAAFIWSYNDLFIMLMSTALSSKFEFLNDILVATAHKEKDVKKWQHLRETFTAISSLTKTVDASLNFHVLLSFINNFFFICIQLLHAVRYENNTTFGSFYSVLSFIFIVVRAVCVSLFAASIPENSHGIKRTLFSVTSEEYCIEVERLIHQVSCDDIALTGCNFFSITRSFLLTVFGTVVTYEIVLVQFNSLGSN